LAHQQKTQRLSCVMLCFEGQHSPRSDPDRFMRSDDLDPVPGYAQSTDCTLGHIAVDPGLGHVHDSLAVVLVFMGYQAALDFAGLKIKFPLNLFEGYPALQQEPGAAIRDMIAITLRAGRKRRKRNH
jgi:hypothetical protein